MQDIFLYIIHSPELTYRKDNVERLVKSLQTPSFNVSVSYITEHEPSSITKETLVESIAHAPPTDVPDDSILKNVAPSMHIRQVSNLMKHMSAIERISSAPESNSVHIVLEDDVVFPENVSEQLQMVLQHQDAYDMLFIGLPATKAWQPGDSIEFPNVFDHFKVLPCIDSYIIRPKAAKQILESFKPIYYPTHFQLTYCITKQKISAKYSVPNVFADGSKLGVFTSLLTTNNRLFLNADYNELLEIARSPVISDELYDKTKRVLERSSGIKNHPDMGYLMAIIEMKRGNYEIAHQMMTRIYEIYKSNGSILNNESEFLRSYIDIHKYLS